MSAPVWRSIAIALATIGVWALAQVVYVAGFCQPHHAWQRVRSGASEVVVDRGEGVARPGDAIFVCETPHAIGPFEWHRDLDCYCAPADTPVARLSDDLRGTCMISQPFPSRADDFGACRHARCSHHVDF